MRPVGTHTQFVPIGEILKLGFYKVVFIRNKMSEEKLTVVDLLVHLRFTRGCVVIVSNLENHCQIGELRGTYAR